MSTFKVSLEKIVNVQQHPNADRLDIVQILDWNCVVSKNSFGVGDLCIYFPIDSVLPSEVESKIFGQDSKIKLTGSRIKTIKLRGAISQGLVVKPDMFLSNYSRNRVGFDLTEMLGVKKYEPPVKITSKTNTCSVTKKNIHPNFKKYTGIENAKNYSNVFTEDDMVSVTEKLHGTNARYGILECNADTLWKKILRFFKLLPRYEFVYGSHNVQLQNRLLYSGYYDSNVYSEMAVKYKLKNILKPGQVIYGEIVGDGIQRGYLYGCKSGERKLVIFDLMIDGKYVDVDYFRKWAYENNFEIAPELYRGNFNKSKILELTKGNSVFSQDQRVREGVVVKPLIEETCHIGRKMLKFISDDYLLKNQDEEGPAH